MNNEFEYVWLKSAVESESSDGMPNTRPYLHRPLIRVVDRQPLSDFR